MVITDKVLCAIVPAQINDSIDEQDLWMDLEDYNIKTRRQPYKIIPLINHPHSDKENGQQSIHYHADTRYNGFQPNLKNCEIEILDSRPILGKYKTDWFDLIRYSKTVERKTDVSLIKNSKLKHKCIYKGKCPHRGFDLTEVEPIDGIITCPLHSLKFDAKTKKLINGTRYNN